MGHVFYAFLFVVAVFVLLSVLRRNVHVAPKPAPANAIVVDGSNVLHWGGEPSVKVLTRVLRNLEAEGFVPIVYFDASVGYRINDRYLNAIALSQLIAVDADHIVVVDKGVIADEAILGCARDHNLRIVSNDRYRDWRVQFPYAARKGVLVRGRWKQGNIVWERPLKLKR